MIQGADIFHRFSNAVDDVRFFAVERFDDEGDIFCRSDRGGDIQKIDDLLFPFAAIEAVGQISRGRAAENKRARVGLIGARDRTCCR